MTATDHAIYAEFSPSSRSSRSPMSYVIEANLLLAMTLFSTNEFIWLEFNIAK